MSPKPTKTSVCETDLKTENSKQLTLETQPENLYELLYDAPDNYFPQESTHPEIDPTSVIQHTTKHHVTIKTSCNDAKQPLLDEHYSAEASYLEYGTRKLRNVGIQDKTSL